MNNLFVNLQKYRPRKNLNPKENFFTELLAFLLKRNHDFLGEFIKSIEYRQDSKKVILPHKIENATIKTQAYYDGKFIDMEIIINDSISIFIENKIESSINENEDEENADNQIENYIEIQKKYDGYVVLLTKYFENLEEGIKVNERFLTQIYWADVYKIMERIEEELETEKTVEYFLIKQFMGLMEHENMQPRGKITKKMVENYKIFVDDMGKLFEEILRQIRQIKREEKEFFNISINNGFNVCKGWIDKRFSHKDVEFSLNFYREEEQFSFCVESQAGKLRDKLEDKDYHYESGGYLEKPYEMDDRFYDSNPESQLEQLKEFFVNCLEEVMDAIESS